VNRDKRLSLLIKKGGQAMKRKTLIAMFVAFGLLALGGISHAAMFDTFLPGGAKAKGEIVGKKLMLQGKDGKWAPAPDGAYKMGDGKSIVVKGGAIGQIPGVGPFDNKPKAVPGDQNKLVPGATMGSPVPDRGGMAMEDKKTKEKVVKEKGGKKDQMMPPGTAAPEAARGGWAMESDKPTKPDESDQGPPPKPDKKGQMMADPATPEQGPVKALPMPQGIQDPGKALPMPQGTRGSAPPIGSPKDPMGPDGSSTPGGGPPPPMPR
jgi:hypothetical protein